MSIRAMRAHAYEGERPEVRALVPATARRVLDLGCASGALGAALKAERPGVHVTGVERDADYARDAAARLDEVLVADLETWTPVGDPYDCVVCADVLEHLGDPWAVLKRVVAGVLAPDGVVVVSLPNVRHWETFRWLAVRGTWPRRAAGIHDATHLRWFTLRDAWALLEQAGLRVERVQRVTWPRPGHGVPKTGGVLGRLPGVRPWVTFQHLLVGRRPA